MASESDLPDFTGKILMIVVKGVGDEHLPMEECRFERHAGRIFLVGRVPDNVPYLQNISLTVDWDNVGHYFEFSPHEFRTVYMEWQESLRKPSPTLWQRLFGSS